MAVRTRPVEMDAGVKVKAKGKDDLEARKNPRESCSCALLNKSDFGLLVPLATDCRKQFLSGPLCCRSGVCSGDCYESIFIGSVVIIITLALCKPSQPLPISPTFTAPLLYVERSYVVALKTS